MAHKKINTIIADDSSEFLEAIEVMLGTSTKYHIIDKLENGFDLLHSPKLSSADLILSDIEMPIMSGIEAACKINYIHPGLKMIAITMYLDKIYLKEIIEAGFMGFIYKPDLANNLFKVVEAVLENQFAVDDRYLRIDTP